MVAWNLSFSECAKPWFCETLHGFDMIFTLPGVQESIENRKEIAPANHMPKKSENLCIWSEKHQNWRYDSGACCPPKITIFRPGSCPAPFWSPSRFGTPFRGPMTSKWASNEAQMDSKRHKMAPESRYKDKRKPTFMTKRNYTSWKPSYMKPWRTSTGPSQRNRTCKSYA